MTLPIDVCQQGVSRICGYSRPTRFPRGCSQLVRFGTAGVLVIEDELPFRSKGEGSPQML